MCGICGIYNVCQDKPVPKDILTRMRDALVHRGPDDAGDFIENNVGLAMRRLNIIDLDTGHQPIHNEDKTIWIVFNGEIYNFPELREGLVKRGHSLYTKSDTEIIIHLYEEEGKSCVNKLNGMFAFAIWDSNKKRIFLARDKMGQKPLFYKFENGQLIFASEIKSILKYSSTSREIDFEALNEYLTFEYIPAPKTIFKGINKLPASHIMTIDNEKLSIERYWNICPEKLNNIDEVDTGERLLDLLNLSIKRHMLSDVPLGVFLSGGIDSSCIASLASRLTNRNLKTFSISFDDASFDESNYSSFMADYIGSEHYEMKFKEKDCMDLVPYIYDIVDEPFADASVLPTYILSKFAKKYITVALGGDGGDELFAGYPTHIAHSFSDNFYLKLPGFFRKLILEPIGNKLPTSLDNFSFDFKVKKFISGINFSPEIRHQIWMGAFSLAQKKNILLGEIKSRLKPGNGLDPILRNSEELKSCSFLSIQEKMLFLDMRLYLQDDILTKIDRCSMVNSLEVRSPYLDSDLVDFVNGLNFSLKLNRFQTKFIFKKLLFSKRIIPKEIVKRPKKGFGIPVAKWINKGLKEIIADHLSEESIKKEKIFNHLYINQILKEHFEHKKDNRKLIWCLFMFELWRRKYLN